MLNPKCDYERNDFMRKLTVRRQKSFVGCAMKVNFYIQDEMSKEVKVNGVTFRKLGALKNETECTFEIACEKLILFSAVDDALSKIIKAGYENPVDVSCVIMDKIEIPAGNEDIVICGKNQFNPIRGNPFIFNRNY